MIFRVIYIGITMLFAVSCHKENPIAYVVTNTHPFLSRGEWISQSDSLGGISVRQDNFVFFKGMIIKMEDVCKHKIIDSVLEVEGHNKIVPYVQVICGSDTIYYKLLERNEKSFRLQLDKTQQEKYVLKE